MLKGLGNLGSLLKQAQQMHGRMAEMQECLSRRKVQGTAGGGMVSVEANGQQKILSISIEQQLFESGDREMLEDLLLAATNKALEESRQAAAEEMGKLAGDVNIPGLGEVLSKLTPGEPPTA